MQRITGRRRAPPLRSCARCRKNFALSVHGRLSIGGEMPLDRDHLDPYLKKAAVMGKPASFSEHLPGFHHDSDF